MSDDGRPPLQSDGWKQWSGSVKDSLEKLDGKIDKLEDKITKHREESLVEVTTLKAKAGIVGMIAGFIASTIMSIIVGLIVYQLTVGTHQTIKPHKHEVPVIPDSSDNIGYVLPPREEHDHFVMPDKEADV